MMNMIESGYEHDYDQSWFWSYWLLWRACLRLITSTLDSDDEHVLVWLWTRRIPIMNTRASDDEYFDSDSEHSYYDHILFWWWRRFDVQLL